MATLDEKSSTWELFRHEVDAAISGEPRFPAGSAFVTAEAPDAGLSIARYQDEGRAVVLVGADGSHRIIRPAGEKDPLSPSVEEAPTPTDAAPSHRDSGRLGKAVEHLVAATCILTSDLRLNVSTSFVDDEGVDLVFARRGGQKTLAVQVKSRSFAAKTIERRGVFRANVRASTFLPRSDLYLLFVPIDVEEGTFDSAWLVPSRVLAARREPNSQGRRVFAASVRAETRDQWSEFRFSRSELADKILRVIDDLG